MEVLDLRVRGPARRTLAFGHTIPVDSSKKRRSLADTRFTRGAICSTGTFFVRGYSDGCLKVWDLRSTKASDCLCRRSPLISPDVFA